MGQRVDKGGDCGGYTLEYFTHLPDEQLQILPARCYELLPVTIINSLTSDFMSKLPLHAFSIFQESQVSAVSVEGFAGVSQSQWSHLGASTNGVSCAGITIAQVKHIPIYFLSKACFSAIPLDVIKALSPESLIKLDPSIWKECITAEHVAVIDASLWNSFPHWSAIHLSIIKRTNLHHPCHGFRKIRQTFKPEARRSYLKACYDGGQPSEDDSVNEDAPVQAGDEEEPSTSSNELEEADPVETDEPDESLEGGGRGQLDSSLYFHRDPDSINQKATPPPVRRNIWLEAILILVIVVMVTLILLWIAMKVYMYMQSKRNRDGESVAVDSQVT